MKGEDRKLIVIVGPTAVGKTDVAIRLAEELKTEIISADSRQIFRELTVGTAKPSDEELKRVKHHFIGTHSIHDEYDAATFGDDALKVITKLFENHDRVILVGGSGLYIKGVLEGFDEMPAVAPITREEIVKSYELHGLSWLQDEVKKKDPDFYQQVDVKNPHRLIRALELLLTTGKSIKSLRDGKKRQLPFEVIKIGLNVEKELLDERIDTRMDKMIAGGLFEEAQGLAQWKNINALQTVGYQEIFGFFDGLYDREEAVRLLKRNSRRYAKRQMTWFRKDKEINWLRPDQWDEIRNLALS